jgi:hypothetical protein
LNRDKVRQEIDDALCKVLRLPNLTSVRELLSREPGLTARDIMPRTMKKPVDDDHIADDEHQFVLTGI